jgi:hypothetical protein
MQLLGILPLKAASREELELHERDVNFSPISWFLATGCSHKIYILGRIA